MKRVRSRGQWDDLMVQSRGVRSYGAILAGRSPQRDLAARSCRRELNDMSRLGEVVWAQRCEPDLTFSSLSSCSFSLSSVSESWNHLKVKQKCKIFSGSKGLFSSQSCWFSVWLYFTSPTKHATGCKIISWNPFQPKQTQPYFFIFSSFSPFHTLHIKSQ